MPAQRHARIHRPTSAAMALALSATCEDCGIAIGQGCDCNREPMTLPPTTARPMPPLSPERRAWVDRGNADGMPADFCAGLRMPAGCYPQGWQESPQRSFAEMLRGEIWARSRGVEPYCDPVHDYNMMDKLYADIEVAGGATEVLDIVAVQGQFAQFYYRIVAIVPATGVASVAWSFLRPTVANCPTACQNNTVQIPAQFANTLPSGCCGIPSIAFIDRASEDSPLQLSVTNLDPAIPLRVIYESSGYCCKRRYC